MRMAANLRVYTNVSTMHAICTCACHLHTTISQGPAKLALISHYHVFFTMRHVSCFGTKVGASFIKLDLQPMIQPLQNPSPLSERRRNS